MSARQAPLVLVVGLAAVGWLVGGAVGIVLLWLAAAALLGYAITR
jgi:hypothetical protein